VFGLAFLLSVGIRSLAGPVGNDSSGLHRATASLGTLVSGTFLYAIAAINVVILVGIIKVFRELKAGRYDEQELEKQLEGRGLMNRFLGRLTRTVTRPQQMYPIGILFGLGFDTATEVALLVLAGGAAGSRLPWYAILCLPILFAAGMSLLDTIDGSFMNFAYGWAFSKPVRKVFYNLTITALSVVVALVIGTIELGAWSPHSLASPGSSGPGSSTSTSTCSGSCSSRCSSLPGSPRSRSGGSDGSRSAGRRTWIEHRKGPCCRIAQPAPDTKRTHQKRHARRLPTQARMLHCADFQDKPRLE
jgi:HoxN/HupN/NixA family high-affinity nickel-transporter